MGRSVRSIITSITDRNLVMNSSMVSNLRSGKALPSAQLRSRLNNNSATSKLG